MRTVRLDVRPLSDSLADFARTWKSGKGEGSAWISVDTPELLWRVLTARHQDLLKALAGQRPIAVHETARRVHRDVKSMHTDVHACLWTQACCVEPTMAGSGFRTTPRNLTLRSA